MIQKVAAIVCIAAISLCLVGWFSIGGNRNVSEIVELLKCGVGDEVIKAHIAEKGMTFDLSAKDIARLKKAGASDGLLAYMISGGGEDSSFELEPDLWVNAPTVYDHLAVFPVVRRTPAGDLGYITLDEAQRGRVVVIIEQPSASVPTVVIRNVGRRPIYIMAGEIIIGGKQDRMISHDVLIPAGKETEVSVRCVEQGRWHGRSGKFKSGGALGLAGVRSALQFKEQQDVWSEVSKACEEHDATSPSGTYGAILSSEDVGDESRPYLEAMKKGLRDDNMVGMIMCLNGEVVCVDIFAHPDFFTKVKDKLLKAYVLDAVTTEKENTKIPTEKEIKAFFEEMKSAEENELMNYEGNLNIGLESERVIGSQSMDKEGRVYHLNLYRR